MRGAHPPAPASSQGRHTTTAVVPVHVEYTVARMGELVMLCLGEGMLSLAITETSVETRLIVDCDTDCWVDKIKSAVSFTSGFLILASVLYLYYRANPFDRHHHAVRRSPPRGFLWSVSHSILAVALITVGAIIKSIHPLAAEPLVKSSIEVILSVAVSISYLLLAFQEIMHPGLVPFIQAPERRAMRIGLFLLKMAFSIFIMALPVLLPAATTEGYIYLLVSSLVGTVCAVLIAARKKPNLERSLWEHADKRLKEFWHAHEPPHPQLEQPSLPPRARTQTPTTADANTMPPAVETWLPNSSAPPTARTDRSRSRDREGESISGRRGTAPQTIMEEHATERGASATRSTDLELAESAPATDDSSRGDRSSDQDEHYSDTEDFNTALCAV